MKILLRCIRPYGAFMLLTLFLKFAASMMDLLIPSLLAKIIDDIVPTGEVSQIFRWGEVMIGCAVISVTTNVRANRMAEISVGGMTRQLRHDLFTKIICLSAGQMDEITVSSAVSRLTSDTYHVNRMLAAALPFIILIVWVVTKFSIPVYARQQKQRIMIARSLAAKPEILILDDASSALDYKTDAKLRKELGKHFRNTTTINIAQRISSIQGADHILVLEDGRCIGYGTHGEILQSCPAYQMIYELQMGQREEASGDER